MGLPASLLLAASLLGGADTGPLICFGNEPSWSVLLLEPTRAVVEIPDERAAEFRGSAVFSAPLGEQVWRGKPAAGKGAELVVFLREGACSDGMSDTVHPVNARVSLPDGRFLAGCCRLPPPRLEGTLWRLTELPGQDAAAIAAARPGLTMELDGGRVSGFSGCNRFAGGYQLTGDGVRFGPLAGTMMSCGGPGMALEKAFLPALDGTHRYGIAGQRLTLTSESGKTLSFEPQLPPRLEGVEWEVTGFNNGREAVVSPQIGTAISLRFDNGVVYGSSGCNSFHAPYTRQGDRISIGPAASTRMLCSEEGVMEQERQFLATLEKTQVWTIRDELLDMHFEGGETRALTARAK